MTTRCLASKRRSATLLVAIGLLMGVGFSAFGATTPSAESQIDFIKEGKAGFVVAHISYVLSRDASDTGACPNGLSRGYANIGDVVLARPDLQRRDDETDADYTRRAGAGLFNGTQNLCMHPEAGAPDPNFRTVTGPNVPVTGGIDLDGQASSVKSQPASGTCAHDDFRGMNGEVGIDNQFFRVVGCSKGYQSAGQSHDLVTEMLTGSWGILITLSGVDDIRNDNDVEVGFYANDDPIELTPTREPLPGATYTTVSDPRFRAKARGRIADGVLTSEPVDVRFSSVFNTVRTERPLRDARRAHDVHSGRRHGRLSCRLHPC